MERENLLAQISEKEVQTCIKHYKNATKALKFIPYTVLTLIALVILHNIFLGGREFDIGTVRKIKNIELNILMVILGILAISCIIAIYQKTQVARILKEAARTKNIPLKDLKIQFNLWAIGNLRGKDI